MVTLSELVEEQKTTNTRLNKIDNRFGEFFKMVRADKLDMLEMMSEMKRVATPAGAISADEPRAADGGSLRGLGLGGFVLGGLAALPAIVTGFVEGVFDAVRWIFRSFKIGSLFSPLTKMLESTFGKQSKIFTALDDLVVKTYVFFDDYLMKPLQNFRSSVASNFRKIKEFFDPQGILGKIFSPVTDGIKAVGGVFSKIGSTFARMFGAIRAFGAVVGRLFVPIGVILSIVDTIKGAVAGFTEQEGGTLDKIIAGSFGALEGLINGLIMMPLDLLKDGISWISEKLGFNNFSALLDQFSFEDLFSDMVDKITQIFIKLVRFPQAVGAASAAAIGALVPGGESPTEAFGRVFKETMDAGSVPPTLSDGTSAPVNADTATSVVITKPQAVSEVRNTMIEKSSIERNMQTGNVTIVNNTNAPTTVSNQTSMIDNGALPSPTNSNGTRADAYSGA